MQRVFIVRENQRWCSDLEIARPQLCRQLAWGGGPLPRVQFWIKVPRKGGTLFVSTSKRREDGKKEKKKVLLLAGAAMNGSTGYPCTIPANLEALKKPPRALHNSICLSTSQNAIHFSEYAFTARSFSCALDSNFDKRCGIVGYFLANMLGISSTVARVTILRIFLFHKRILLKILCQLNLFRSPWP